MPHKDVLGQKKKKKKKKKIEPKDSPAQLFQTMIFVHGEYPAKNRSGSFKRGSFPAKVSDKNFHAVCYRLGPVCCMTKLVVSQIILAAVDTPFLV